MSLRSPQREGRRRASGIATNAASVEFVGRFSFRSLLGFIAAFAFALRVFVTVELAPATSGIEDAFYFGQVAHLLATGKGFVRPWEAVFFGDESQPSAEHPPLYPLVLAAAEIVGIRDNLAQRSLGAIFGTTAVVLLGLLGRRVGGPSVGIAAAAIAAVDPQLLGADAALLSETLYTPLLAATLLTADIAIRSSRARTFAVLGCIVGLCALTRSEALLLAILLPVALSLSARGRKPKAILLIPIAAFVVVAPWVLRNFLVFGRPILSNNGGSVLAQSNCERTYSGAMLGNLSASCLGPRVGANEAEVAANWSRVGITYAREHATRLPIVAVARVLRVWGMFHPLGGVGEFELEGRSLLLRYASLAGLYVMLPFAVLGWARARLSRARTAVLAAPILMVTVVAALAAGWVRFRHAAEPSLVIFAALGLVFALASANGGFRRRFPAGARHGEGRPESFVDRKPPSARQGERE